MIVSQSTMDVNIGNVHKIIVDPGTFGGRFLLNMAELKKYGIVTIMRRRKYKDREERTDSL